MIQFVVESFQLIATAYTAACVFDYSKKVATVKYLEHRIAKHPVTKARMAHFTSSKQK